MKRPLPLDRNAASSHTIWEKEAIPSAAVPEATAVYQHEDTLDISRTADMLADVYQPHETPLTATAMERSELRPAEGRSAHPTDPSALALEHDR